MMKRKVTETDENKYNWLILDNKSQKRSSRQSKEFELPDDIFVGTEYPEEVSRMERLYETKLAHPFSLVWDPIWISQIIVSKKFDTDIFCTFR